MIHDPLQLFSHQRWLIDSRSKGIESWQQQTPTGAGSAARLCSKQNILFSLAMFDHHIILLFNWLKIPNFQWDQFSNISTSISTPCVLLGESEAQLSIVWHMKGLQYYAHLSHHGWSPILLSTILLTDCAPAALYWAHLEVIRGWNWAFGWH